MHSLYFVKLKEKEKAQEVARGLLESNNFAGETGFYGSAKADWFQVGGRFSGLYTRELKEWKEMEENIKPIIADKIKATPNILDYLYINEHLITKEQREEIDLMFTDKFGLTYFRPTYPHVESADDVIEITKESLAFLKEKYNDIEIAVTEDDSYIEDEMIVDKLSEDNIGEYLVIIDYHN